jgi:hypothetical protein
MPEEEEEEEDAKRHLIPIIT